MALGDSYATLAELKARIGIGDTVDDTPLTNALATASRGIERHCNRQFNNTNAASTRVFEPGPSTAWLVRVDDFYTTTGLVVATDSGDDGTYETVWASSDYQLEPLNGVVDGESGWPFYRIRAVAGRYFPLCMRRASVQVTAQWGWTAVPAPVKEACLVAAEETFKLKDTPFGVAGYGEYGSIRVRDNPKIAGMLRPYRRDPVLVG